MKTETRTFFFVIKGKSYIQVHNLKLGDVEPMLILTNTLNTKIAISRLYTLQTEQAFTFTYGDSTFFRVKDISVDGHQSCHR